MSQVRADQVLRLANDGPALHYANVEQRGHLLSRAHHHILGEILFNDSGRPLPAVEHPCAQVGMQQLGEQALSEIWLSPSPVETFRHGDFQLSHNGSLLFGCLTLADQRDAAFEARVHRSYLDLLNLVERQGYPHLLRLWNYFPDITAPLERLDRYQHFCRGRFQALADHYGEFIRRLPAASAVGSTSGDVVIYFIAARHAGEHRENPRQMSAYHYPPQYGPRSPSFARATLMRFADGPRLFVSGTASIVGHESRHPDDPQEQLQETLRNLRVLIDTTAQDAGAHFDGLRGISHLKIYLRDAKFLPALRATLDAEIDPAVPRLMLRADICRTDLLLEIEAVVAETPR